MKKISLLSMFGLAFMVVQVTNAGAQAPGYAPGTAPQYGNPAGAPGYAPGTAPHLPLGDDPSSSGSSYHLNQPVNQGGVNGVIAESSQENNHGCTSSERWEPAGPYCVPK